MSWLLHKVRASQEVSQYKENLVSLVCLSLMMVIRQSMDEDLSTFRPVTLASADWEASATSLKAPGTALQAWSDLANTQCVKALD